MKKTAIFITALFTATSLFAALPTPKQQAPQAVSQPEQPTQPMLFVGTIKNNSFNSNLRKFNRTDNKTFCWVVRDLPQDRETVSSLITFQTPQKANFSRNDIVSKDKTIHQFSGRLTVKDGIVGECWEFEKTDPVGRYSFQVAIEDLQFPVVQFELVE